MNMLKRKKRSPADSARQYTATCALHQSTRSGGEKRLLIIIGISFVTMVGEIVGGTVFGSMALLADGWHMGTHVLALGIAYAACVLARRIARDRRFGFGPAKVSALGGFAGSILLGAVAFEMVGEGVHRLFSPEEIFFNDAIIVAVIGLVVNAVGALLLHDQGHTHDTAAPVDATRAADNDGHSHRHGRHGHDTNMRSAYLHVITDALTSVLAIAALILGRQFGWLWADATVAMLGGIIILKWAYGLLKESGATLLDFVPHAEMRDEIESTIQGASETRVTDLHIWPQGSGYGVLATVTSHRNQDSVPAIHQRLTRLGYLNHITIEMHPCTCC